jgi:CHAD domain-containing protein
VTAAKSQNASQPGGASCVDRQRAQHLAAMTDVIFAHTRHLHGLTKPCLRLLQAAAQAATITAPRKRALAAARTKFLRSPDLGLDARQRRIVLHALDPASVRCPPTNVAAWSVPGDCETAMAGVSLRMAAILEIAKKLDEYGGAEMRIVGVVDDGEAIELRVSGGLDTPLAVAGVLAATGLWQQLLLRPIRRVGPGPRPAGRLVQPRDGLAAAGRRIFQRLIEQLISRQYGLAYNDDVEFVHEMRVAIRRLRAAMRIFRVAFQGQLQHESQQLRQLAEMLGAARDSDVFLDFLQGYGQTCPKKCRSLIAGLVETEKRARRQNYRQAMATCRSEPLRQFLENFYQTLRQPAGSEGGLAVNSKQAKKPLYRGARKALGKRFQAVVKFGPHLQNLSSGSLHELRIACKKLRYATEFFSGVYPPKLQGLIDVLVKVQDLLGTAHDLDLYRQQLRVYFEKRFLRQPDAKAAAAVRSMRAHMRRRKRQCIEGADTIWKSLKAPRAQGGLKQLLRSPRTS